MTTPESVSHRSPAAYLQQMVGDARPCTAVWVQQRLCHGPKPQGPHCVHSAPIQPLLLRLFSRPLLLLLLRRSGRRHEHPQQEVQKPRGERGDVAPRDDGGEQGGDEVGAARQELVRAEEGQQRLQTGVAGAAVVVSMELWMMK